MHFNNFASICRQVEVHLKLTAGMINMKFSEDELRKQIADVRGKISSLESTFDIGNGSGFGGGISDERQINYQIQYKKDQESRLIRDLNDLLLKKTKKSSK